MISNLVYVIYFTRTEAVWWKTNSFILKLAAGVGVCIYGYAREAYNTLTFIDSSNAHPMQVYPPACNALILFTNKVRELLSIFVSIISVRAASLNDTIAILRSVWMKSRTKCLAVLLTLFRRFASYKKRRQRKTIYFYISF